VRFSISSSASFAVSLCTTCLCGESPVSSNHWSCHVQRGSCDGKGREGKSSRSAASFAASLEPALTFRLGLVSLFAWLGWELLIFLFLDFFLGSIAGGGVGEMVTGGRSGNVVVASCQPLPLCHAPRCLEQSGQQRAANGLSCLPF
jgi:hypothetical protein